MTVDWQIKKIGNNDISDNLLGYVTGYGDNLKDDMKYDFNIDYEKKTTELFN